MYWMESLYNITNHAGSNVHSLLLFGVRKIGSTLEKFFFFISEMVFRQETDERQKG